MIYTSIPKCKPKKPTAAQRQLAAEWDAILKKYEPKKKLALTAKVFTASTLDAKPYIRDTGPRWPSLDTGQGIASSKPTMKYTGTKMIGIGTLHKSNAIPVFSDEEAIEIAKMRRG